MASRSEDQNFDAIEAMVPNDTLPLGGEDNKSAIGQNCVGNVENKVGIEESDAQCLSEDQGVSKDDSCVYTQTPTGKITHSLMSFIARPSSDYGGAKKKLGMGMYTAGCEIQGFDPERELRKLTGVVKRESQTTHYPLKTLQGSPSLMYLARPSTLLPQCSSSTLDLSNFSPVAQAKTSKWDTFKGEITKGEALILDDQADGSEQKDKDSGKDVLDIFNIRKGTFGNITKFLPWLRQKWTREATKTPDMDEAKDSSPEKAPRKFGVQWIQNLFGSKEKSGEEALEEEEPDQPVDISNTIMNHTM